MEGSKSHVLLLAVALASTALAGCMEAPAFLNTSDVEVSAFEHRDRAEKAALAWNEHAVLVSVMAFELTESPEARIDPDPEVGNGLAPAWWYVYCAAGEAKAEADSEEARGDADTTTTMTATSMPEIRAFKVTADGTVSSEDDAAAMATGYSHDMAGDLGDWTIDSTAALEKAKTDESFTKVAEGFNASVVEGVASHEGTTAWFFAAMSADGFVVATVDALTGELLDVSAIDMGMTVPTFEFGARDPATWTAEPIHLEGEGYAAPGEEAFEAPLSVVGPMHGTLTVDYMSELPTDGLHWAIMDAEGELVDGDHLRSWIGGDSYEYELGIDEPGEYTFTIFYMSWTPLMVPVGPGGVDYSFALDLMAGEHEDEEDDG